MIFMSGKNYPEKANKRSFTCEHTYIETKKRGEVSELA